MNESSSKCLLGVDAVEKVVQVLPKLQIAPSFFIRPQAHGTPATTSVGVGWRYDLNDNFHLPGYMGRGIENTDETDRYCWYASILFTFRIKRPRKFAERYWPLFEKKPWACSATEVEWRRHGFDGSRLGYLLAGIGLFHQAHRAIDDCRAMIEILAADIPKLNRSAFAVLLERARRKTIRIWAEQSPFELKDTLKKRGYGIVHHCAPRDRIAGGHL